MTRFGSTTYTYTLDGHLATKTVTGQSATTYQYDVFGNLSSATLANGTRVDYVVDGRNRRVGKKINGTLTQAFLYQDALRPIAELDGSGNVVSRFVYDNHSSAPAYMIKGGVEYRIVSDQTGSPRLLIDSTTGQVVQRMDNDQFGRVTADSNPGFQPFGFGGGVYDGDTGLVRFGARDYDPETGRFTAPDPAHFGGGQTNLYVFTGDDPINGHDPSGLYSLQQAWSDGTDWALTQSRTFRTWSPTGPRARYRRLAWVRCR